MSTAKATAQYVSNCQERHAEYEQSPIPCLLCGSPLPYVGRHTRKFCSKSCAASYHNRANPKRKRTRLRKFCGKCRKPVWSDVEVCHECRKRARLLHWRATGLLEEQIDFPGWAREALFQERGRACEVCGWAEVHPVTRLVPVTVHHINGNTLDHCLSNLQILCPNHHSLTPSYGNLNHGKGRSARRGVTYVQVSGS